MTPRSLALVAASTLLGLALTGCSGGSGDSAGSSSDAAAGSSVEQAPSAQDGVAGSGGDSSSSLAYDADAAARGPAEQTALGRAVISTGTVALRAADVGQARADVQEVVDRFAGTISQEKTDTDDEGAVRRSRLVVRIPAASFAEAMVALEGAADLVSSDTSSEDVTTQVIDNRVRLQVQRRSIARIQALFDRAESIRDVVSIESQLSQRQATLDSLEQQQAYLADQTSQSTITVSLQRTPRAPVVEDDPEETTGFLAGLAGGWHGLKAVTVGLTTVVGALLPFAAVLLVLAVPGVPLLRRLRRARRTSGSASGPAPGAPGASGA